MASQGRIVKELAEVGKDDKVSGIKAVPVTEGDIRHLKGTIPGPQGTPYEGGIFEIDIVLPKQYPFEPPKMKYLTKIWHPNISSQTGAICLVSAARCGATVGYLSKMHSKLCRAGGGMSLGFAIAICRQPLLTYRLSRSKI